MEDPDKLPEKFPQLAVGFVKMEENSVRTYGRDQGVGYDYIICALIEGRLEFIIDDRIFPGEEHCLSLVKENCHIYNTNKGPSHYLLLRFTKLFAMKNMYGTTAAILSELTVYGLCYRILDDLNFKALKNIIKLLEHHTGTSQVTNSQTIAQICFNLILSLLSQERGEIPLSPSLTRKQAIAIEFLHLCNTHCHCQHKVGYYAQKLCTTRGNLTRTIKEVTGQCPKSLIEKQLILCAKERLDTSLSSIYIIAEELNFNSSSGFVHFFRSRTGQTPAQYRNRITINTL